MMEALMAALRLWPGIIGQPASSLNSMKSIWLPHFKLSSRALAIPAPAASFSCKNAQEMRRKAASGLQASSVTVSSDRRKQLQQLPRNKSFAASGIKRIARAMLSYFGAGAVGVAASNEVSGHATVHASERPKHVAEARALWQRAVANGILQQQEEASRGPRLPYSTSPFSSQMLPLEMPHVRANYRGNLWPNKEEVSKQGSSRTSGEFRNSELQWELSPSSRESFTRNSAVETFEGHLRKARTPGSIEESMDRPGNSVISEGKESIQGSIRSQREDAACLGAGSSAISRPIVQRSLTTKVAGSEWELTFSTTYMSDRSSIGSSTLGGDSNAPSAFRRFSARHAEKPASWTLEGELQAQNASLGSPDIVQTKVVAGGMGSLHSNLQEGIADMRRASPSSCQFKPYIRAVAGSGEGSRMEPGWEEQWEVVSSQDAARTGAPEKSGQGEISRWFDQMSCKEREPRENWGKAEAEEVSALVTEAMREASSRSHASASESETQDTNCHTSQKGAAAGERFNRKSIPPTTTIAEMIDRNSRQSSAELNTARVLDKAQKLEGETNSTPLYAEGEGTASSSRRSSTLQGSASLLYPEFDKLDSTSSNPQQFSHSNAAVGSRISKPAKGVLSCPSCESVQPHDFSNISQTLPVGRTGVWNGLRGGSSERSERQDMLSIGEALCHSQTRARQAEEGAVHAQAEKERLFALLLRECSVSYASRQWAFLLQAENMRLRRPEIYQPSPPCCILKKVLGVSSAVNTGLKCTDACLPQSLPALLESEQAWEIELGCFGLPFLLGMSFAGAVFYVCWKWGWIALAV